MCRTEEELDAGLKAAARAGGQVVIEELLEGEEVSVFALCDGSRALPLAPARDFKRLAEGDVGPNTGGMGSYSPVAEVGTERLESIVQAVHAPVLEELARRGTPFIGLLFAGLMLTDRGVQVLEFNCRFGDPETQSILPRLEGDLLAALAAAAAGDLGDTDLSARDEAAVTVVLAAGGYPERSDSGTPIEGVEDAEADGALVFHAGTAVRSGRLLTNGGRVLNVTAVGDDLAGARAAVYRGCERISFAGMRYRHDIAGAGGRRCRVSAAPSAHPTRCRSRSPCSTSSTSPGPLVGILVGSESDREAMEPALEELDSRGISHEFNVLSAHRDPRAVAEYASTAALRGVRVLIAGAGMAAALPGVVASYSELPVIGVPLRSSKSVLDGLDALLAIVQMPPGVPVACVSVDGARNAALLACAHPRPGRRPADGAGLSPL